MRFVEKSVASWPQWKLIIVFIAHASDNPWLNGSVWNQCVSVMSLHAWTFFEFSFS